MKKISIIIPCYNASKYINKCLEALKNQDYKNFSVICIDDASTDSTYEIINDYKLKNSLDIHIIRNYSNCGPAHSRNRGVLYAKSEFITFCDSDDWYEPNYLQRMIDTVEKNNTDIAFCGYQIVSVTGEIRKRPIKKNDFITTPKEALGLGLDSLCMLIVKKELLMNCPWPNIRNGEDMAMVPLLICKCKKIAIVHECLYNYFTRSTSLSNNIKLSVVDSFVESFEFVRINFPCDFIKECEFIGINNLLYGGLITLFTISKDKDYANEIIENYEKYFPFWIKNPYIKQLPKYKKIVLFFIKNQCFFMIRLIAMIRKKTK